LNNIFSEGKKKHFVDILTGSLFSSQPPRHGRKCLFDGKRIFAGEIGSQLETDGEETIATVYPKDMVMLKPP
jgi:hypothetical protein